MNNDSLLKAISSNKEAVVYALDATAIVQESMERIDLWPPAAKHLGQAMMAALLLQALSDSEEGESLSLQWNTRGPFGSLYAEARNFGEVRGTIQHAQPNVADYETGLGEGLLQVRRAKGSAARTSMVNATGQVSADIVEFLEQSEQKNCGINLSVVIDWDDKDPSKFRVKSALAYLVHIMPQPTEAKLNEALLRWDRQMQALGPISRWVVRPNSSTLDMLRLICGEENPQVVMNQRVKFACKCNTERAERALALLEAQEKKEGSFHQIDETNIRCEYCGKTYKIQSSKPKKAAEKSARKTKAPAKKTGKKKAARKGSPKKRQR